MSVPSGCRWGVAGSEAGAHQHRPPGRRQRLDAELLHQLLDAGEPVRPHRPEQVMERQHRVGLAAAEVRLQLHHRIAAPAGQPPHGAPQQLPQPLGQVGAAEEVRRVAVFGTGRPGVHLGEIGGELRLLQVPRAHILVGDHHLPPGAEPEPRLRPPGSAPLDPVPRALVADDAQEFLAHRVGCRRLLRRPHPGEQPLRGVERPVGVLRTEGLLVGEGVPDLAELAHPGPLGVPERLPEDALPVVPHRLEEGMAVPAHPPVAAPREREMPGRVQPRRPVRPQPAAQASLHERRQPLADGIQRPLHPVAVRDRHDESRAGAYRLGGFRIRAGLLETRGGNGDPPPAGEARWLAQERGQPRFRRDPKQPHRPAAGSAAGNGPFLPFPPDLGRDPEDRAFPGGDGRGNPVAPEGRIRIPELLVLREGRTGERELPIDDDSLAGRHGAAG